MKSFVTPIGMQSLLEHLEEYGDRKAIVEVRSYKRARSIGLNAYHWAGVITPIAEFIGESPGRVHEIMCGEYFGWVTTHYKSLEIKKPRRTTTTNENGDRDVLNWEEMSNFMHFCKAKAAESGAPISEVA